MPPFEQTLPIAGTNVPSGLSATVYSTTETGALGDTCTINVATVDATKVQNLTDQEVAAIFSATHNVLP